MLSIRARAAVLVRFSFLGRRRGGGAAVESCRCSARPRAIKLPGRWQPECGATVWQARAASIFFERLAASGRYYYSVRPVCPLAVRRVVCAAIYTVYAQLQVGRNATLCAQGSCGAAEGRMRTAYDVFRSLLAC